MVLTLHECGPLALLNAVLTHPVSMSPLTQKANPNTTGQLYQSLEVHLCDQRV